MIWVMIPPVPPKGKKVSSMRTPTYSVQIVPAPRLLRGKTAGEVRFIKDKSESGQWAFNENNQSERQIRLLNDYTFNPKNVKPLVCALRSTLMALGHAMSAYTKFSKIKSTTISPDGMLGGKGYILKIKDMRSMYMNAVEAMSSLTDTLYDEVKAEHWKAVTQYLPPEAQKDVEEVMDDVDAIKDNPEAYADAETKELDKEGLPDGVGKVASQIRRKGTATWVQVNDPSGTPVWTGPMTNLLLRMGGDLNPVLALRPGQVARLRRSQVWDLVLDSSALRVASAFHTSSVDGDTKY